MVPPTSILFFISCFALLVFGFNIGGTLQHGLALRYGVKPYRALWVVLVYRLYGLTEAEIKIVSIRGCNSSMVRVA